MPRHRPTQLAFIVLALLCIDLASPWSCAYAQRVITVASDGSGQFVSVQAAVDAAPRNNRERVVIRIGPGDYHERIVVPADKPMITFEGAGPEKTHLSYHLHARMPKPDGGPGEVGTSGSASVQVFGDDFIAKDLSFINTTPRDIAQAVAFTAGGDRMVFENVHFVGWQDTLYTRGGRQYYRRCLIEGGVDFIFGDGTALFEDCEVRSKRSGYLTAARTAEGEAFGYVFYNCRLTRTSEDEVEDDSVYLGRPWRDFANVAFVDCWMDAHLRPAGWHNWGKPERELTSVYRESGSTGPGHERARRVGWTKAMDEAALERMRNGELIEVVFGRRGEARAWRPGE